MEKLIELLKEYDEIRSKKANKSFNRDLLLNNFVNLPDRSLWESELIVISSSYWFIQWLILEDKVDINWFDAVFSWELDRWKTLLRESGWDEVYKVTEHWCYESLLMQLSVKDNPIEFLISILK